MNEVELTQREQRLQGYAICPGIAVGAPYLFAMGVENIPEISVAEHEIEREVERYYCALKSSRSDLLSLQQRPENDSSEIAQILAAHLEIMKDPVMTEHVEQQIRAKGKNTEYVFKQVIGEYQEKFSRITSQFFRQRVQDFHDISRRVMKHLRKDERCSLLDITTPVIVFAHELAPSDTAEAKTEFIEAFVTRTGAETSHVAIMARAKGIPFVSSVDFPDLRTELPELVIVDGMKGEVILNPTQETRQEYRKEQKKITRKVKSLQEVHAFETKTSDGHKTKLSANIEMLDELDVMNEYGVSNIGLFRSEYLFLARDHFPSEEEQFVVYRSLVEKVISGSCVIRTFDLGGDKLGGFYPKRHESNPFLGCRAVRLMLKERVAFKAQLKAILRASAFGEVGILFPLVADIEELRQAKLLVEEAKEELWAASIPFARNIPIGCMIEVPSAAFTCDILAKECDFFSIGTNDLVQYTLAVDRSNTQMSYLYQPCHPSVIRMIKLVVQEANQAKIPVSVCGEIAANPKFTPLLLGLGVHELSVALPALTLIKNVIRQITIVEAQAMAKKVEAFTTAEQIEALLNDHYETLRATHSF